MTSCEQRDGCGGVAERGPQATRGTTKLMLGQAVQEGALVVVQRVENESHALRDDLRIYSGAGLEERTAWGFLSNL